MKEFWNRWFGKGRFLGVTRLDIDTLIHFRKHGKFINAEILAHCPICNKDHKVLFFQCKCGDRFFTHLNKAAPQFKVGPFVTKSPMFE